MRPLHPALRMDSVCPSLSARSLLPALTLLLVTLCARGEVPFGIRIIDEATGRGVPLVTLSTVNHIRLVTDSAGWAAFDEPGLMNREVFFSIASPGYAAPADGFGYAGVRLTPTLGATTEVKIMRLLPAQRLRRLTGQGIYRDSSLLGREAPLPRPLLNGDVMGQDSVQAAPYRGRIFWLWGDTLLPPYPLGHFRSTGAWSDPPSTTGLPPQVGVHYEYLTDAEGGLPHLFPPVEKGAVWLAGLTSVKDGEGEERLIAHYGRYLARLLG